MKSTKFILSAFAALFISGASSAAQNSGFYASAGLTGFFTKFDGSANSSGAYPSVDNYSYNFWGPSASVGYRFDRHNALQLDASYLATEDEDNGGLLFATDLELTAAPVLLTYSLCAPLGKNDRWEIRLSPTAGIFHMRYNDKDPSTLLPNPVDATDTAFAYGLGASLVWNITKHLFLDFNFRYLRIESMTFTDRAAEVKLDTQHSRLFTLSLGCKF